MDNTTRKVMIRLTSTHSNISAEQQPDGSVEVRVDAETGEAEAQSDTFEMDTEGLLRFTDERVEIEYFETELTGMDGACTCVSFERENPGLVTMLRTGAVETVLVFEQDKRNICAYNTPELGFELTVHTYEVRNSIGEDGGTLALDYAIEFRGASTEQTSLVMDVTVV